MKMKLSQVLGLIFATVTSVSAQDRFSPVVRGDDYILLMRHQDVANGYFSSLSGIENIDNPNANTYSIIGAVDPATFLINGHRYELELTYKYSDGTVDVLRWSQSSWITEPASGNVDLSAIIDANSTDEPVAFRGLAKSTRAETYLDGSAGHGNWFHAVASVSAHEGGIPAHEAKVAYHSELWARKAPQDNYELLMRHDNVANGYFSAAVTATGVENADNPNANTYSIIGAVDPSIFLINGQWYELELTYEYPDGTMDVLRWSQSSWITEPASGNVDLSAIIDASSTVPGVAFRGLAKSTRAETYLDGSAGHIFWFHAVASVSAHEGGIPAHEGKVAYHSELWARKAEVLALRF